jgi:predicted LPLAT superfamily acyltransferase
MSVQWTERKEIGNAAWLTFARITGRTLGRRVVRGILYPVALYFFFRRGPERRASRQYLQRLRGGRVSSWSVLKHIYCFSCTILDRLYLLSERFKRFDIRTFGLADLDRLLEGGQGVLLIGSHLGSFDALRVLSLERPEVMVRILLDTVQGERISALLNELNPSLAASIINARDAGPAVAIKIKEALDRNAIVAVLADRGQPSNPMQTATFLGRPASFPTSPWLLAAALKVPVMLAFGLYRGGNRYDLHFELFAERIVIERARRTEAVGEILQRFADRLAHYAHLAPYNWFNFYDFWQDGTSGSASHDAVPHAGDLVRRS